ncbi:PREDICTED: breast carcinoma-amplified sequence 4 [Pygoscelis adeliae]|uniref:breast carcinoma-amplified sequence 4 n=1 Tax=Pygoscelis adeliae TaxID=9238 RepID=UPI0004F4D845|nr:PREDICTED: breast carcinoma-amplified sequence 4 [Pygoscelis adeliae]
MHWTVTVLFLDAVEVCKKWYSWFLESHRCVGNAQKQETQFEEQMMRKELEKIRSDTSQILDETIPLIKDKVMEINHIYAKVDKLEAFVKMVARHVSFLEEQVLEAEKSHGTFLNTVCKLFQCATISSFKNRHPLSAAHSCDLPKLYRTEDFFSYELCRY